MTGRLLRARHQRRLLLPANCSGATGTAMTVTVCPPPGPAPAAVRPSTNGSPSTPLTTPTREDDGPVSTPPGPAQDPTLGTLMAERRRLLNIGYRMLGSLQDAEGRGPGDLRPLVQPARGGTAGDRRTVGLVDAGRLPDLPRPPHLGPRPPRALHR